MTSRACVLLLLCLPASAAAEDALVVYGNAGIALPNNPPEFVDLWSNAWSIGGGVGVRVSRYWEFAALLHFQQFPTNEAAQVDDLLLVGPGGEVSEIASIEGRDATSTTVLGEVRFHFQEWGSRWDPYMTFGAGVFEVSMSDAVVTATDPSIGSQIVLGVDDTSLASTVGAGVLFRASPGVGITLDAAFTIGFTERVSMQYLPVRAGVAFSL